LYRINGVCGQCLLGTSYNTLTKLCENICKANEIFNGTSCVCASGFTLINGVCDKCPVGSYFDETLKKCVVQPTCPLGAEWNQAKLQCQCTQAGVYLINGTCKSCDANAAWNGSRCVCRTGFFLINGKDCLTCDLNSFYNSTLQDCVCNRGFYGDRNLCQKCDATCGKCSGPNANQCLDCADVSLTLSNGVCAKPSQCVAGMYLNGTICRPCSAYCASCTDENTCKQCTSGFSLSSVTLTPTMIISMCEEICGDGKRYEYDCDDGNTINGDGCNDQCQIETGYTCGGGTTTSKSVCVKLSTPKTVITPKGAVQLSGKVMQGVTLSYLPDALTQGGCPKCS
jgi:proprotein convertase subtilisin/kexin type 5